LQIRKVNLVVMVDMQYLTICKGTLMPTLAIHHTVEIEPLVWLGQIDVVVIQTVVTFYKKFAISIELTCASSPHFS